MRSLHVWLAKLCLGTRSLNCYWAYSALCVFSIELIDMRPIFLAWLIYLLSLDLVAQPTVPTFTIKKTKGAIQLDGVLDEVDWQQAEVIDELWQQFPNDTSQSVVRTEFRATHDDRFIYFSAVSYDNIKGGYVISSLRRDFRGPGLDGVTFILDTFQDVTNGFFFGLSPAGVQREGLIANGYLRRDDVDLSWDNKWYSASKISDGYWTAEVAIPFKTIRFKAGAKKWNVKFYRQDSKENERAIWPLTPRIFEPGTLSYHGEMVWDEPLGKPGSNVSLIPYVADRMSQDFQNDIPRTNNFTIGGDAKIAVTPSLNLDLTINPDFSQVEVDRQVTNLDRFELVFPEKRQFFLENADLFASYGHLLARPFFSRRLGVLRDPNTGQNLQTKIHGGLRLSGNLNKYWRIGLLNMQTAKVKESGLPSFNNTVGTLQRRVGTNSNIRAIVINQQQFKTDSTDFKLGGYNYNRLAGLDYNYNFFNNKWTGNAFFHKQISAANPGREYAFGYSSVYSTRNVVINWFHQGIGRGYSPTLGYVPRSGYDRISPSGSLFFYPKSKTINSHGPMYDVAIIWDDLFGNTDREWMAGYNITFQSQASLTAQFKRTFIYLFSDFDPTNSPPEDNAVKLPTASEYRYGLSSINFISDPRKKFTLEATALTGTYFNGTRQALTGLFNYRMQPYGLLSLDLSYNRIKLPKPYASADIFLISPRVDLTLTKSVFFTTYFQYNSQYTNININSRFQWRFKPVSDLFIVYTDNYFYSFDNAAAQPNFSPKNRAIVLKLTYWLNM